MEQWDFLPLIGQSQLKLYQLLDQKLNLFRTVTFAGKTLKVRAGEGESRPAATMKQNMTGTAGTDLARIFVDVLGLPRFFAD